MDSRSGKRDRLRTFMVPIGIILFVIGFMLTILVVQSGRSPAGGDADSTTGFEQLNPVFSHGVILISGIMMSLTGVVLATIGPATGLVRRKV